MSYPDKLGYNNVNRPYDQINNVHRVEGTGSMYIIATSISNRIATYAGMTHEGYRGEMPNHIVKEPEM